MKQWRWHKRGKKKKKKAIQHYYLLILENKLFTKHFRREDIDVISMSMDQMLNALAQNLWTKVKQGDSYLKDLRIPKGHLSPHSYTATQVYSCMQLLGSPHDFMTESCPL